MHLRAAFVALVAALVLGACAAEDLSRPPEPLGEFQLGHNIAVARNAKQVGPSRKATAEEWETAIEAAVARNIGRYQGDKLYHIGIGVDAYALALPGVPILLSPKSVLVVTVNVWDDTARRIVNAEPRRFTIFERLAPETVLGSGLTQSRQRQIDNLAANAVRHIGDWLVENKAWFSPEAAAARALLPPMDAAPAVPAAVPAETGPADPADADAAPADAARPGPQPPVVPLPQADPAAVN